MTKQFATFPPLTSLLALLSLALVACGRETPEKVLPPTPPASPVYVVQEVKVHTMTAAFGQIDSADAVVARARVGGTVRDLRVREGDMVERGKVLAVIVDARVPLQAQAQGAEAAALQTQLAQERSDLERYERLHANGFFPTQRLDEQRALIARLQDQIKAARSQRAVTVETGAQGAVLAPVAGRVLRVPVREGGVAMMGEEVALVGSTYIIRLRLPERHSATLQTGGAVEVEALDGARKPGAVQRVYPALADGRVEADITADGLESRVYGERLRVWTQGEPRRALVVPASYLSTRYGVDFARVRDAAGDEYDVVVRRGDTVSADGVEGAVEVLSGLSAGDQLILPPGLALVDQP